MRSEAVEQLDVLVGSWRTTMKNAWFLEPDDLEVPGSANVEWDRGWTWRKDFDLVFDRA